MTQPTKRRRLRSLFQWQLSSILVLTAVIGLGLAFYVRWIAPYREQFAAREKLEELGGRFEAVEAEPAWMVHLVGKQKFHHLVTYRNETPGVTDVDLRPLADLPYLTRLYLDRSHVGNRGALFISRLEHLERLSLWRTTITDEGLPFLAECEGLKVLDIHSNCVTDEGLKGLEPLRNMRQLSLGGAVCGPGLESVAKLPVLAKLNLERTAVSYESLGFLEDTNIEDLWLSDSIPAAAAESLSRMPRLQDFHGTLVGADDSTAELIARCRHLRAVSLSGTRLTDVAIEHLAELPHLKDIQLSGQLTDETLFRLAALPGLTNVELTGRFSFEAIESFQVNQPTVRLSAKSLAPAAYYLLIPGLNLSAPLRTVEQPKIDSFDPLIHVWAWNTPRRTSPSERPLRARVYFPATAKDLAQLDFLHRRLQILEFFYERQNTSLNVLYDSHPELVPETSLRGLEAFQNLEVLRIHRCRTCDLDALRSLPKLRELIIDDPQLTDEELAKLQLHANFNKLTINAPRVTSEAFLQLRRRYPAIELVIQGDHPTNRNWSAYEGVTPPDRSLADATAYQAIRVIGARTTINCDRFAGQQDLNTLIISGYEPCRRLWRLSKPLPKLAHLSLNIANDQDMSQLKYCPALTALTIDRTSISDQALKHLAHTPKLQRLRLSSYVGGRIGPWITGSGLKHLSACPDLRYLGLSGTPIRGRYLEELVHLQKLNEVELANTEITDADCKILASLPALEILQLSSTKITDEGLRELAACPRLQTLDVSGTQVTDRGVEHLPKCKSLQYVKVRRTQVSEQYMQRFSERYPTIRLRNR